jgi:hypothetical protein
MIVNPGRMYSDTCSVTNSKSTPFILELNIKKYLACELIKKKIMLPLGTTSAMFKT